MGETLQESKGWSAGRHWMSGFLLVLFRFIVMFNHSKVNKTKDI